MVPVNTEQNRGTVIHVEVYLGCLADVKKCIRDFERLEIQTEGRYFGREYRSPMRELL
jgi:hypothetical protein